MRAVFYVTGRDGTKSFPYSWEDWDADVLTYEAGEGTPRFTQLKNDVGRYENDLLSAIDRQEVVTKLEWFEERDSI